MDINGLYVIKIYYYKSKVDRYNMNHEYLKIKPIMYNKH